MPFYQIGAQFNFEWSWFLLFFAVLILATFYDLKNRTIPNWVSFGGILYMIFFLWISPLELSQHLIALLIGFIVFYGLYALKALGGGDAKLLMFVSLSVGPSLLLSVWLWIFLIGGIQALYAAVILKQKSIPYAVSILLGSLLFIGSSFVRL